ncbi:MAG: DUF1476 domain-containing protein [Hyphomonadaceae bacterium]|jgi:hypothetical protein|nr:DUF1476 domain-containing protein [Hyphomonadaceae bacterium]
MTTFDDRERAEESRFAMTSEQQFKTEARRNKLLGAWVAEKLGLQGDDAEAYAKSVVLADFQEVGDDDVVRKVLADLDAAGVADISEHVIRRQMADLLETARAQLANPG